MEPGERKTAQGSHRKGKRARRRTRGVAPVERDGYWHAHGRVWIGGRSVRVRRSLGLAVKTSSEADAWKAIEDYLDELKARLTGGTGRGDAVAVAARGYLTFKRERPLKPTVIRIVKEIVARFGDRRGNEIAASEWNDWIDGKRDGNGVLMPGRMSGRAPATRERFIAGVMAFLHFAQRNHRFAQMPVFERDKKARNANRRQRRRVAELRPELLQLLLDSAHISIRAQMAVERCCGARVSSIIYAARVCDLVIGKDRAHLTFPQTKNGEDVHAALDASTIEILRDYLAWRGNLHDREAPLFLTYKRRPYVFNGLAYGGQNKTGFRAARRRACATLLARGEAEAEARRARGDLAGVEEALAAAQADAALLGRVTQHWFRHRLASQWLRKDPRAAMEQGGWLDIRSVMGYAADAPEYRHRLVDELDDLPGKTRLPI